MDSTSRAITGLQPFFHGISSKRSIWPDELNWLYCIVSGACKAQQLAQRVDPNSNCLLEYPKWTLLQMPLALFVCWEYDDCKGGTPTCLLRCLFCTWLTSAASWSWAHSNVVKKTNRLVRATDQFVDSVKSGTIIPSSSCNYLLPLWAPSLPNPLRDDLLGN